MKGRLAVISMKRVPNEEWEHPRVKLTMEDDSSCTIVVGGRSKNKPSYSYFTVSEDFEGEKLFALWDKEAERISLFGSEESRIKFDALCKSEPEVVFKPRKHFDDGFKVIINKISGGR